MASCPKVHEADIINNYNLLRDYLTAFAHEKLPSAEDHKDSWHGSIGVLGVWLHMWLNDFVFFSSNLAMLFLFEHVGGLCSSGHQFQYVSP